MGRTSRDTPFLHHKSTVFPRKNPVAPLTGRSVFPRKKSQGCHDLWGRQGSKIGHRTGGLHFFPRKKLGAPVPTRVAADS